MSILRTPPKVAKAWGYGCYAAAGLLLFVNLEYSQRFFAQSADGWGAWIASIGVELLSTGGMILMFSADEIGHLFAPAAIQVTTKIGKTIGFVMKLLLIGIALFFIAWAYKLNWQSTLFSMGGSQEVRWFLTALFVFMPEWILKIGFALIISSTIAEKNMKPFQGLRGGGLQQPAPQRPASAQQPQRSNPLRR